MARKVIIDTDPGIDDAVALSLALSHPDLEVVAVTATGGSVGPEQATRNVQAVIEQIDPARWPRIGVANSKVRLAADARHIHGADGLGEAKIAVAELVHQHPAEKVICDELRDAPEEITIVALGPLTNLASALRRDPDLVTTVGHLIIAGGAVTAPGNATAAAEFNIFCNPSAARDVFRSPLTKTLVPLDATGQVVMTYDLADQLPGDATRTGKFLDRVLPFAFRAHRQHWAMEGTFLHGAVALVAALHPELFQTESVSGDVETAGELTTGATIFDRRPVPESQPNMEVATSVDAAGAIDCVMRGLTAAC